MKEFTAAIILISLLIAGIFNYLYIDNFTKTVSNELESVERSHFISHNQDEDLNKVVSIYSYWKSKEKYCKIMLPYDDYESVCDAFTDLINSLKGRTYNTNDFDKLQRKIKNISLNEKISLSSVF